MVRIIEIKYLVMLFFLVLLFILRIIFIYIRIKNKKIVDSKWNEKEEINENMVLGIKSSFDTAEKKDRVSYNDFTNEYDKAHKDLNNDINQSNKKINMTYEKEKTVINVAEFATSLLTFVILLSNIQDNIVLFGLCILSIQFINIFFNSFDKSIENFISKRISR